MLSTKNSDFWNEMCGSTAFRQLGLSDISPTSLSVFDEWYFEMYSYLTPWLESLEPEGLAIVEVGLGFGSVGHYLATKTHRYTGIDIARGPVDLVNYRLVTHGLPGSALVADVLNLPLKSGSQDLVVAIGSLHHVGDFENALAEIRRVLRPGGRVCGMVYAAYSLRSLVRDPGSFFKAFFKAFRSPGRFSDSTKLRKAADINSEGEAAPFTEFFSKRALRSALEAQFGCVQIVRRNANSIPLLGNHLRPLQLRAPLRWIFSLDLYFVATAREGDKPCIRNRQSSA